MNLIPGAILDGYEILELLGAGGMGEVYRARDPVLKREVAIKVLPAFVSQQPDRLRRFEQEAQAAAALNHPNILAIYRFGVFEGSPYLVSELLEGRTLRQLLGHGPLPVRQAIGYGAQIANGTAAAHEKGIVHRDLKPENLFVSKDGRVKILDFGLAKLTQTQPQPESGSDAPTATHHATEPGVVMGTIGYMAPEQVRGLTVDPRTDIFALGAVLYEMLAGKRAFQRSTSADTMSAILNEDPPAISQIVATAPSGLQRVIQRCLEKNPEQRFQSASDLAFALEALSESGISSGAAISAPVRRWPRKAIAWSTAAVAILSLAAVAYHFATRPRKVPFAHYTIQKLMDSKHVRMTAISPDGNYLAAVIRDVDGAEILVLHHIPTGSERPILKDSAYKYRDITFSPDGSYIYFKIEALGLPPGGRTDEYRVPVLGGQPFLIAEDVNVNALMSFIEGSRRLCFYRHDDQASTYQFVSASMDGGDEQVLAKGSGPVFYHAVCAPNGKLALFSTGIANIESLNFASGSRNKLLLHPDVAAINLGWTSDGKFFFATLYTWPKGTAPRIGMISYPGGEVHQITNDLTEYQGISLNEAANTIATTSYQRNLQFAELSLADLNHFTEQQTNTYEFVWSGNDRTMEIDDGELSVTNLTKNEKSAVYLGKLRLGTLALCGSDALVASGREAGDTIRVYEMRLDGTGQKLLTKGSRDLYPQCTAEGKWLFYVDNSDPSKPYLMRQSLNGGTAQRVMSATVWYNVSPDGKSLALVNYDSFPRLQVISTDSLKETHSFPVPKNVDVTVAFSSDNSSVFYSNKTGADTTIWRQGLAAATADKVTVIPGQTVDWIEASPDGKKLGLTLQSPTQEAVLIREAP